MKLGPLYITWRTAQVEHDIKAHLRTSPAIRELVTKMARSEVKNYMAALAEEAEVPFDDPVSCLRNVWNLYQYGKSPAAQARDKEVFGK